MDVMWSGYAQVYVQYYSSVVVETMFVWVYSITCTQYQCIKDPSNSLLTTQPDMVYDYCFMYCLWPHVYWTSIRSCTCRVHYYIGVQVTTSQVISPTSDFNWDWIGLSCHLQSCWLRFAVVLAVFCCRF